MTTRKTPSTFRLRAGGGDDTPDLRPAVEVPLTDSSAQVHAVATAIASARQRAELLALAEAHDEALVPTTHAGLDLAACDDLLDPTGDVAQRQASLRRLLAAVAPHAAPDDGLLQLIHDEAQFQRCWAATLGWGAAIQDLLSDTAIHTITIMGTTVLGVGPQGRVVRPHAYASTQEPRRCAEFLVQACGRAWNRATPALRLTFHQGTCIHLYREPLVGTDTDASAGLLIVIQRGRRQLTTLGDLVAQGMLDRPAAELLAVVMHADCNVLVSGPAGVDTTSVLEALVNTRTPETTLVLVESGGPPLALAAPDLVTRLPRDPALPQTPPWASLPFTPDRLVLHALRADEAGAMLQQAEAGLSVVASIEAATIHAALRRLARQAALPHSSFAGDPAHALRVISDTFHVVVHVGFDPRLSRTFVQEVALLGAFAAADSFPTCLPLVTTTRTDEAITWTCRAHVEGTHVVWNSAVGAPPERLVQRLASIPPQRWQQMLPDLLRPPGVASSAGTSHEPPSILDRARAALQAEAWEEAAAALNEADQSDDDPAVRALLDEAFQLPAFVAPLDTALDAATQRLRAALAAWDLDQAQRISAAAAASPSEAYRRTTHQGWQEALALLHQGQAAITTCQTALTQASSHRQHGDLRAAIQVLRPIAAQQLPPDLARTLLTARRSLLSQVVAQTSDDLAEQQQDLHELEQVNQALAAGPSAASRATPTSTRRSAAERERTGASVVTPPPAVPAAEVVGDQLPPARFPPANKAHLAPDVVMDHLPPALPPPLVPPPVISAADASGDPPRSIPMTRTGWLDAALAHSRERARLRQAEETALKEQP